MVNPFGFAQNCMINMTGAQSVAPGGTQITLPSASPSDTNTLSDPNKVVPVQSKITGLGKTFRHVFPPYSLTVLKLSAK